MKFLQKRYSLDIGRAVGQEKKIFNEMSFFFNFF